MSRIWMCRFGPLLLAVGACGAPADRAEDKSDKADEQLASTTDRQRPEPKARSAAERRGLTLAAGGLEPGLPFGTAREKVVAAATGAFGAVRGNEHNDECGEGPMDFVNYQGLSLSFQEDKFVGWSTGEPHPKLRTAGGLAIGAPKSALKGAKVEESTLGAEFDVGGVGGLLDEQGRTIAALWAGYTCQFR